MDDIEKEISAVNDRIQAITSQMQYGQRSYDAFVTTLNELRPRAAQLRRDLADPNMQHWCRDTRTELGRVSYTIGRYEADIANYDRRLAALEEEYGECCQRLARLSQQLAEMKAIKECKSEDEMGPDKKRSRYK